MRVEYLLLFLAMGLVTYLTRIGFLGLSKNVTMPDSVARSLKYIPFSILATLILPGVLAPEGRLSISLANPYIYAAIITILAVLVSKKPVVSIVLGIASLVLIRTLI